MKIKNIYIISNESYLGGCYVYSTLQEAKDEASEDESIYECKAIAKFTKDDWTRTEIIK